VSDITSLDRLVTADRVNAITVAKWFNLKPGNRSRAQIVKALKNLKSRSQLAPRKLVVDSFPVGLTNGITHPGFVCDVCGQTPIKGIRWQCLVCDVHDICGACQNKTPHHANHALAMFPSPVPPSMTVVLQDTAAPLLSRVQTSQIDKLVRTAVTEATKEIGETATKRSTKNTPKTGSKAGVDHTHGHLSPYHTHSHQSPHHTPGHHSRHKHRHHTKHRRSPSSSSRWRRSSHHSHRRRHQSRSHSRSRPDPHPTPDPAPAPAPALARAEPIHSDSFVRRALSLSVSFFSPLSISLFPLHAVRQVYW
jgi:hypothetical protein